MYLKLSQQNTERRHQAMATSPVESKQLEQEWND